MHRTEGQRHSGQRQTLGELCIIIEVNNKGDRSVGVLVLIETQRDETETL